MSYRTFVSSPVTAFILFLIFSQANLVAQLPRIPQLRAVTRPAEITPDKSPLGPKPQLIATSTERIDRDLEEIRVYRNGRPVELFPQFHELLTATQADHREAFASLVGRSVALVPTEAHTGQWDVYLGVASSSYTLAGNIFVVKQVLLSSRKNPIVVRVNGQIHSLKPGQALLLL
jgi:predicted alternative tryptophan synthase beta-subunit